MAYALHFLSTKDNEAFSFLLFLDFNNQYRTIPTAQHSLYIYPRHSGCWSTWRTHTLLNSNHRRCHDHRAGCCALQSISTFASSHASHGLHGRDVKVGSTSLGGHRMALEVKFEQGFPRAFEESSSGCIVRFGKLPFNFSFPQGLACIAVWPLSQPFLAPSPFSLTGISPNKILACYFPLGAYISKYPDTYSL